MTGSAAITPRAASHACIIATPDEALREQTANALAAALVCEGGGQSACGSCRQCRLSKDKINPDVIEITRKTDDKGKQKRELSVEQIRAMGSDAYVRPQEAEKKVYIIRDAGFMNDAAQNAALKLLEEPPAYACFILCADSAERLLATIRSRCVIFRPGGEEKRAESELAVEYLRLAADGDRAGLCSFFGRNEGLDADAMTAFLAGIRAELCALLSMQSKMNIPRSEAVRLLALCERAQEYARLNVGAKHIMGLLCVLTV